MTGKTIPAKLRETVDKHADRIATTEVAKGTSFTFCQLEEHTNAMAANLISLGLKPQDRIGIYAVNHYQWVVANYAAIKAGLIVVCINPAYQPRELSFALNHVGMKAIVSDTNYGRLPFSTILNAAMDINHQLEHVIFMDSADFNRDDVNVHQMKEMINDADSSYKAEREERIALTDFDSVWFDFNQILSTKKLICLANLYLPSYF